ncbi:MAG: aminotransferase class I/II-fold pyridoxal phosphate-dependent enzyme [Mariprofundus sp.]|nr:aminotransferase class I/II-fold pyridoxal phosphate-dependent enzyme [Mariprofundus sp.]
MSSKESGSSLPQTWPHGGGIEAAARAWQCNVNEILDLSTGLHPDGAPDWLGEWLQAHAALVAHYPDIFGEPARTALADALNVKAASVLITAGAQAVIEVVFQAMGWRSLAIEVPCYNEPLRCAQRAGCRVEPFEHGERLPHAEALWWTSPHNPSGRKERFPDGWSGVLDESYMLFSERRSLGLMDGVIRLGSLTKSFCIPGLRIGYVIADAATIRKLDTWLPPWPSSTLALQLLDSLLPEADLRDAHVAVGRERLVVLLHKYRWRSNVSQASFVLAQAPALFIDFARYKILVREFPEWPQLKGWIRFGLPGSESDWQRLESALAQS